MKIINSAKEIDILYELRCSYIHGLFRMDDISVITKDIHRDALLLSMRIGESDNNSIKNLLNAKAWINGLRRVIRIYDAHKRT